MAKLPSNEPILDYAPGSPERSELKTALQSVYDECPELLLTIGGQKTKGFETRPIVAPHRHKHVLANAHFATEEQIGAAIESSLRVQHEWANTPLEERLFIFEKAADLLATEYRMGLNAATMAGQSKTAYQAEIDSACEMIDFWRFNAAFARQIAKDQPISVPGELNSTDYRPLEGFVLAISPFNFTAIGGNLPTAPAMMGNVVLWKPSDTQILSAHRTMEVLERAGLPPGVINLVYADGPTVGRVALAHPMFAGLHFTGSSPTFNYLNKEIAANLSNYRSYPRIIGETGGKDFVLAHPSANVDTLSIALLRGAFEFQGQKCSAASRAYIPASLWPKVKERLGDLLPTVKMGAPEDFENFVGAVIDKRSFDKISGYIDYAEKSSEATVLFGGKCDDSVGYFIEPTVIVTDNPKFKTMTEEIFGPVLTIYPFPDEQFEQVIDLVDTSTDYALTGAIFAREEHLIERLSTRLRFAAGNFYINDKPTGAVVGRQPFGGARGSGTNDKAGSLWNMVRWISPRTIKRNPNPPTDYRYPYMGKD